MKRTLSILITLLLLWSLVLPAAAADTTAATLRLEKTEGTVTVSNASGKTVSMTDGMRLYSGYTLATGKESYAYVSLDSTKAVELDASSKAEVQKSGKKLELTVTAGKLFFNVTAPVEKNESVNIRTSTMVTGVRGTSGWVEVVDRFTSRVHLLEGTLTVTSAEPVTGQMRQVVITGGQTATATLNMAFEPGQQAVLTVTPIREEEVPGFVAVEIAKDPVLQGKITEKSPLSVPEIIGNAEERLEAEQKSADLAQKAINEQLEKISADQVEQVFESQPDDDDDDDGGSDVSSANDILTLNNPTAEQLNAALARTDLTRINVINAGGNDLSTVDYTVSSGQTLDIQSGTFTVGTGKTLTVNGTFTNSGTTNIEGEANGTGTFTNTNNGTINIIVGTANISGYATNSGTITIISANSLHVAGSLTNNGTIQVGGLVDDKIIDGQLEIQSGGTLNNSGSISIVAGYVTNAGNFFMTGGTVTSTVGTGIYVTDGTVEISGGTVSDKSEKGTGVNVMGGKLTMTGGTVTSTSGIGIDVTGGTVEISGGSVEGYVYGIRHIPKNDDDAAANVAISGSAVITLTETPDENDTLEGYAVSGPFTFNSGILQAQKPNRWYEDDYTPQGEQGELLPDEDDADGDGYFQLTLAQGD